MVTRTNTAETAEIAGLKRVAARKEKVERSTDPAAKELWMAKLSSRF